MKRDEKLSLIDKRCGTKPIVVYTAQPPFYPKHDNNLRFRMNVFENILDYAHFFVLQYGDVSFFYKLIPDFSRLHVFGDVGLY